MKSILIILCAVCLTGCVAGHKYNYEASSMDIPVKPSEQRTLILSVEDWRPYVLSRDKEPNFIGLQRGGFGEPWDVTTTSGKPMTEDMSAAIVRGLKDAGYNIVNIPSNNENVYLVKVAGENSASRIVVLKVIDWKSDVYMGITLNCNLHLSVFDAEGNLLAESKVKFKKKIGGGSWATIDDNSRELAEEFAKRVRYLFNEHEVRRALQ
jgi:hypothetical protein